ncbi:MAG: antibiotic biosynthesis monooxygenase [Proteobacteria bacterium]|nr:MAG: antibiotic biosynthesis monooxygenase [Pseudomonadota bacterium]
MNSFSTVSLATVSHCALVTARHGHSEQVGLGLSALVRPALGMPGCLHFAVQRSHGDERLWQVAGVWRDHAAMTAWFKSPGMQVFSDLVQGLLVTRLDLHTFEDAAIEQASAA